MDSSVKSYSELEGLFGRGFLRRFKAVKAVSFYVESQGLCRAYSISLVLGSSPDFEGPLIRFSFSNVRDGGREDKSHMIPQRSGGKYEVEPLWPSEHSAKDPYRDTGKN
jgi:hypothetical protein